MVGIVQSLVSTLAIIGAAIWAWIAFDPTAQLSPSLDITQSVSYRPIDDDVALVVVNLGLKNTSKFTLSLSCADTVLYRMLPLTKHEMATATHKIGDGFYLPYMDYDVLKWNRSDLSKSDFVVEAGNSAHLEREFYVERNVVDGSAKTPISTMKLVNYLQSATGGQKPCAATEDGSLAGRAWKQSLIFDVK